MSELKLCKTCNHKRLVDYGFKKYSTCYKISIPLYKHEKETMISTDFSVSLSDNSIHYDVMDVCNQKLYSTFYDDTFANTNLVLDKVNKELKQVFNDMVKKKIIQKRGICLEENC